MKIGLISDTHSYIDKDILKFLNDCDEIWHAGDVGDTTVLEKLEELAPLRAVYGNIDDAEMRKSIPHDQVFEIEGKKVWITHIGAYPPNYNPGIKKQLDIIKPDIFICGHSHILKVIPDKKRKLLHINPGAAGQQGFHKIRTLILFELKNGSLSNMKAVELGKRGKIKP